MDGVWQIDKERTASVPSRRRPHQLRRLTMFDVQAAAAAEAN